MKKRRANKGLTLIELMIAMAVFSIVMTAVYGIYISCAKTAGIQNASAWAQQNVRGGLELMARDIRLAGLDATGGAGSGIEEAKPRKIRVTSDRNQDGDIDETDFERVSYMLSGSDLRRILYEGTGSQNTATIIENVAQLKFAYSGSEVKISLAVEEPAGRAASVNRSLVTTVHCRNLDY
ncbi:MAG: prepilin-type N-terminal cleavage/methylation domain-containing protein [Desulfobacterales bacterium]|nr:prepilin-type N-terminal cleavage/methylation domain-containing protein [Desulfobacterales bacterium]